MALALGRDLDPLDLELVERAFECVLDAIETDSAPDEFETDEEFEIALRRELAEMVRSSGISDVDALLDLLLEHKSGLIAGPRKHLRFTSVESFVRQRKHAA